jgi:amino acid transporter
MMAKASNKFSTFGGVYVPSVLTILGVIMYLRLPWVVGNGGLYLTLGIILAAHVISITTGLSISSIATDKKVGAGGPYYIVSRSLGLPIGGTLGLALFVGLAFSVSLYVIGFSESFLSWLGMEPAGNTIRICGTITIVLVTMVTVISTALAIKTQYIILGLIVASIISIAWGDGGAAPAVPHLEPAQGAASFAVLFGIFFPAVTGFTAGVNMSGDLQDPKKSIPVGTMCAIATGLVTYIGLAIFLAYYVQPEMLTDNTQVLIEVAALPAAVLGGIWGATLSSAMGSILGAPRILQALSVDRVTPRYFAKGAGKTNEPRRALLLAFAIAEAGILIGELDIIARIVSMFFMATYGFLNLSCAIESWASTDFRPSFKIPKMVSVIGAVTCLLIMVQLDLLALFGATSVFAGLFIYLKRRELTLETGDTWEGVWSSMARTSLARLGVGKGATREYRPNVLCFSHAGSAARSHLLSFGATLVRQRGLLSDFELSSRTKESKAPAAKETSERVDEQLSRPGIFRQQLKSTTPYDSMASLMRFHGFAGLQPNTVMLAWPDHQEHSSELQNLLAVAEERDLNVLLMAPREEWEFGQRRQLDLWWSPERGNFAFVLALARYITSDDPWQLANVRFLVVNDEAAQTATLYRTATRLCTEGRLEATVKVLNNTLGERSFEDWVRRESAEADLVVVSLPHEASQIGRDFVQTTDELIRHLGNVLLTRASSQFVDVLASTSESRLARVTARPAGDETLDITLPKLELPPVPELAAETLRVSGRLDAAAAEFIQTCLGPAYRLHHVLVERMLELVDNSFNAVREILEAAPGRQRKAATRIQNNFLQQSVSLMSDFGNDDLPTLKDSLEHRIEWLFQEVQRIKEGTPAPQLTVYLSKAQDSAEKEEEPKRRLKKTVIPLETLLTYHLEGEVPRHLLEAFTEAARFGSDRIIKLAKVCNATRNSLSLVAGWIRDGELTSERLEEEYERVARPLRRQGKENDEVRRQAGRLFLRNFRQVSIELSGDFMRPELGRWVRHERRLSPEARDGQAQMMEVPQTWTTNETLLVRRAELELLVAVLGKRLAVIAERTKDSLAMELRSGITADLERLLTILRSAESKLEKNQNIRFDSPLELSDSLDDRRVIDDLVRKTLAATAPLPDAFETINEESILRIETDPFEEAEMITVAIRRRIEFLVQAEFIGRIRERLGQATQAQRHALGVARDVIRLVSYNINDIDTDDEEESDQARERLAPILEESIQRLEAERQKVLDFGEQLPQLIDQQFELVTERTDAYAITGSEDGLRQYVVGDRASQQALSRFARLVDHVQRRGRDALGTLFYRRSAGLVFARQLRSGLDAQETLVESALRFVETHTPQATILQKLPFYYQQPFLGKTRISADFWIGRTAEGANARQALQHHRQGAPGALIVTGPRNSGKSSFCRTFANTNFRRDRIHHVFPPPGGAIEPALFQRALETELGSQGSPSALLSHLPEQSVVVFHDTELWWQRSLHGLAIIEQLEQLIDEHSRHCLFVVNLNVHAFRFLKRVTGLRDRALAVVDCGPLDAQCLKDIIMIRHKSTGLGLELAGRDLDAVPEWRLARLFSQHFDYCGGIVGVALQSWIAHIVGLDQKTLEIKNPSPPRADVLHELPMEWLSLLLELCLHKQVTEERLQSVTEIPERELHHLLTTLVRMGLVTRNSQGVIETNRYVDHVISTHLVERRLLA